MHRKDNVARDGVLGGRILFAPFVTHIGAHGLCHVCMILGAVDDISALAANSVNRPLGKAYAKAGRRDVLHLQTLVLIL